ncbi:sensory box histidine kinase/response regulator [Halalkalibacter wakoensis JCM 9140]|uniref:histidine kinase n=1 Tax=Halalkalibacter wakoensis JCM 9140 TaxID=1236970 RepID=W4Q4U5_9BACI|nr:ATP-binding protein [Halalkalibacter wakoensis]GAE26738.1 sensory box histidine kinase/response regulator [Halalkalibacter wakoensis JCM 9140]
MFEDNPATLTLQKLTRNLLDRESAHIIYMFSEYDQYVNNALAYISDGLNNGDKILVFEDQTFYYTLIKKLQLSGYTREDIQSITFQCSTTYYGTGEGFSADKTLEILHDFVEDNVEKGIRTRIWGQVQVQDMSISELRKYECQCDKFFSGKNFISICTYNGLLTPAYLQNELLKVHEYLMVDQQLERSPFYHQSYVTNLSDSEVERLKKLESENDELRRKNERLLVKQARQKEREKFLDLARENAEKANIEKSAFLSQMSHDLRTPLNTIQGYIQVIQMNENDAELQWKINRIYQASEQLLKLIEEILDFTVIDSGKVNLNKELIKLKSFLHNCVDSILETPKHDIQLHLEKIPDDFYVEADPVRLNQIIMNLLTNAIKYNQPFGVVNIFCSFNEYSNEIQIHIKDNGIGIEQKELDLIFEPFYRSKRTMDNWEGTGLGLAIVAQLTKRMNGTYGVTSEIGKGSTFWVSFKKVKPNQSYELESTNSKKDTDVLGTGVFKILYIEDNQENRDVMAVMLQSMDHHIDLTFASTGEEGINKVFEDKSHLVLLDLNLPDINGFDVLNKLKSNPITKEIPVVAVSADALESTIKRALLDGCAAYVTKPVDFKELRGVLQKVAVKI